MIAFDPIPLPRGRQLITLEAATDHCRTTRSRSSRGARTRRIKRRSR
jgi:hypothetical protein